MNNSLALVMHTLVQHIPHEQLLNAAADVRALPASDDIEARFFASVAGGLTNYAYDTAREAIS